MEKIFNASEENIENACEIILSGGVIIAPTDSVYGIFCDALNHKAVERVSTIKMRDAAKPLQVAVRKNSVEEYAVLTKDALKVIQYFWPGDVNIVVEKKSAIPDYVSKDTVCLTCHRHKVAARLVKSTGRPLVSTSANFTGKFPAVWVGDLDELLTSVVDLVLDGGSCHNKRPNTIVDATIKPSRIIREGPITRDDLSRIIDVI